MGRVLSSHEVARVLSGMPIDYSLDNPYLDIFQKLRPRERYMAARKEGWRSIAAATSRIALERGALVKEFACAVPNPEAITAICDAATSGIVSIGAGGGYWEYLLSRQGLAAVAFDIVLAGEPDSLAKRCWFPVQKGDERSVFGYPEHSLFLCWPLEATPVAANALSIYEGDQVIYVGEDRGGWTADDCFFDLLDKEWTCVQGVNIPNWPPGVRDTSDRVWIYRRKHR